MVCDYQDWMTVVVSWKCVCVYFLACLVPRWLSSFLRFCLSGRGVATAAQGACSTHGVDRDRRNGLLNCSTMLPISSPLVKRGRVVKRMKKRVKNEEKNLDSGGTKGHQSPAETRDEVAVSQLKCHQLWPTLSEVPDNNDSNIKTTATTTAIESILKNFTADRPWSMTQWSVSPSNSLSALIHKYSTRTKLYYCTEHTHTIKWCNLILYQLYRSRNRLVPKKLRLTVTYDIYTSTFYFLQL